MILKKSLPQAIAVAVGILALIALVFGIPQLSNLLLGWAAFLAAVALLLGVLNLFAVHLNRLLTAANGYSGVLVLSMAAVFFLAFTDAIGITEEGVSTIFDWVQAPLEAALAALMAFFLLFAVLRLLRFRRTPGKVLFLLTIGVVLLSEIALSGDIFPAPLTSFLDLIRNTIDSVFVAAGMRGILLGVALGTITLSLRLLASIERPYDE